MAYLDFAEKFAEEFWVLESTASRILITAHTMPDDDAVAAALAMSIIIKSKYPGKVVRIMLAKPVKERWGYFFAQTPVEIVSDIADHIQEFDLAVYLDGNYFERFSDRPEELRSASLKTVCIDHHLSKADVFSASLIEPAASSTSELIYRAFAAGQETIGKELAEVLLLGILGDTGQFRFVNAVNAGVLEAAADLIRQGQIDVQQFMSGYSSYSERVYSIIKEFVKQSRVVRLKGWPDFNLSVVSRKFAAKGGYTDAELESASSIYIHSFGTSISSASWGVMVYPLSNGKVKIGLRSRTDEVNVRSIMEQMGIGSGHDRSSGGIFKPAAGAALDSPECVKMFKAWLRKNKQ